MTDIIIELLRVMVLAVLLAYVYKLGKREKDIVPAGWGFISAGFAFLLFGSLMDIADNFSGYERLLTVGDMPVQSFLAKVIGYIAGFLILAVGFEKWLPSVVALRQSEERIRSIVHSVPGVVWEIDSDGMFIYVSPQFTNILGYEPDEVVGHQFFEYVYHEDAVDAQSVFASYVKSEKPFKNIQFRMLDKIGTVLHMESTGSPFYDDRGKLLGFRGIQVDVTDRIMELKARENLEEKLRQAQKLESLGTLVAGVAHEINNPTNVVTLNIRLFRKVWNDVMELVPDGEERTFGGLPSSFLKENMGALLQDTEGAGQKISLIVDGLKDFSRKKENAPLEEIDVNEPVKEALKLVSTTFRKSEVGLEEKLDQNLPLTLVDAQGLSQVVVNLLINGMEAIDHDEGRVSVSTGYDVASRQILLKVSDNGCGIDPLFANKIFDPFYTQKLDEGGTGLGLSISHGIVMSMDGEISFTSTPGEGTTFTVALPIRSTGGLRELL